MQCHASARPCLQPSPAVLKHSYEQLGPGSPYAHGKFEWAALTRLASSLQVARAKQASTPTSTSRAFDQPSLSRAVTAAPPSPTADALTSLADLGYCVIGGVIPPAEINAIRESVLRTTALHGNPNAPPTIGHMPGLHVHDQSIAPHLSSPKVLEVIEAIFGGGFKITFTTGQTNHPGCERQEWHADWPFAQTGSAHIPAPYADVPCHITALWMLDTMNDDNGTILLPGSHKASTNPTVKGVFSDPMAAQPREMRATGEAGSVLLIDSRLWHAIPPNPTGCSRVAVAVRYAPWWLGAPPYECHTRSAFPTCEIPKCKATASKRSTQPC